MNGSARLVRSLDELHAKPEKCGGRVLNELREQAQRLGMMVSSLEETFGPVLRPEVEVDCSKASGDAVSSMPEFLEAVRQSVWSIESNLNRIQSLIHRSEL